MDINYAGEVSKKLIYKNVLRRMYIAWPVHANIMQIDIYEF